MDSPVYSTSIEAEAAFYEAFQRRDLEAMMHVWADDDSIVCVHPFSAQIRGRSAIAKGWQQIFEAGGPVRFEPTAAGVTQDEVLAVHCLHENISHGQRFLQRSRMSATNVYKLTELGWRMIVHHASPEQPVEDESPPSESQTLH